MKWCSGTVVPTVVGTYLLWCSGAVVLWYCGAVVVLWLVLWYCGTYCGAVVLWYCGAVVQWYCGRYCGTVVQCYSGTVVLWYSGTVVQWYCGTVQYSYILRQGLTSCTTYTLLISVILLLKVISGMARASLFCTICTHVCKGILYSTYRYI